ncbi:lipoyltransferase 1, mitochondrial-like isoform X1 [Lytechinus variegatus]|uniref:lipoyltransferase 1, mitochondrial-like isoform X1 n=1 Tax=Lytechinus variegatus TaxID=7654 RepID=UPI001BB1F274|nr:lipoyltransferase 1, mitochondrial-like isoform X1 [Lytechinus variegatus]
MALPALRLYRYFTPSIGNALLKNRPLTFAYMKRTIQKQASKKIDPDKVKGLVYVSTSTDIHTNLSLEDWIYNNTDLSDTTLMILWRNDPCVVIGRHQNPWAEVNLRLLWNSNVKLARRRSGGGTVYHDLGNLNITFFSTRERYNRSKNLDLISRALKRTWPHLSVSVSERDDLIVDNFFKISGTSSKLGRKIAYHHCTLLHSVDKTRLKEMLHVSKDGLNSKATPSIRSKVKNLADIEPAICHDSLVKCISNEFYRQYSPYKESRNANLGANMFRLKSDAEEQNKLYEVNPTDEDIWKGIPALCNELRSWDWVYGKTPRFSISERRGAIKVTVHVYQATIEGIVVEAPPGWMHVDEVQMFADHMKGQYFWSDKVADAMTVFLSAHDSDPEMLRKYRLLSSMIRDAAS